ncbi:hypothetical protein [Larkinella rosea]|uniref:Uncharacterized protein n=1 Tax=Larkinella rosea TaxID=2025312 RepID=A0A3P1BCI6_9BACT|nr:hypothetical protein [Larkinella rosea]RRA98641.1 hypothetical protein EHT25_26940 [Larkinella rosea]
MNQGFKLRFDQMQENNPADPAEPLTTSELDIYPQPGYGRQLCLIWPDGRRMFFNYAYLVTGEFDPNAEKNNIKLSFSSHVVLLQGYGLERLFMALLDQLPRQLIAIDPRYILDDELTNTSITDIIVEKKD